MQFKVKPDAPIPQLGDKRVRKFFTSLPAKIKDTVYWMEEIEVCEVFKRRDWGDNGSWLIEDVVTNHPDIEKIRRDYPRSNHSPY